MCVIFIAYQKHPEYPLILAANRDEFYERPTATAQYWADQPEIYAGRDLIHGGTWLGVSRSGRLAAVTNYRDPKALKGRLSRGNLVSEFLISNETVSEYLEKVADDRAAYSGFNLIIGEISKNKSELAYYSNRENRLRFLEPGLYGLSNHLLETPWPKVRRGKSALAGILMEREIDRESIFEMLKDRTLADDEELPETGIGYEREKLLSSVFIETPFYGTRSSSVVIFDKNLQFSFEERTFY